MSDQANQIDCRRPCATVLLECEALVTQSLFCAESSSRKSALSCPVQLEKGASLKTLLHPTFFEVFL
jgi:hypothetical protein